MPFILALLLALAPVTAAGEDLLCRRLGGSDAVSMVVKSFLTKMRKDDADKLGRFWLHRGSDGVAREEQLIVDFVQSATGCDRLYVGRSMADTHRGMGLSAKDWDRTVDFLLATMNEFKVAPECCRRKSSRLSARRAAVSSSARPTRLAAVRPARHRWHNRRGISFDARRLRHVVKT